MNNDLPEAPRKYRCEECYEVCSEPLIAVNPFDSDDRITGCPHCKSANSLVLIQPTPRPDEEPKAMSALSKSIR